MPFPVFISYARRTSRDYAEALHAALGGKNGEAFLDTSDIELGERFPPGLIDALLNARVVVVFWDEVYVTRWYCLRELQAAISPYQVALRRQASTASDLEEALSHIVVAFLPGGRSADLDGLPPALRTANWPAADQTERLAEMVTLLLSNTSKSIRERLPGPECVRLRQTLLEEAALPPARPLSGLRTYHPNGNIEQSIHDRFVGRADELASIHFRLSTMRGYASSTAALSGSVSAGGGFGKTRLALEYVHRYGSSHYPGGVFWINADMDVAAIDEQFHGVLRSLCPHGPVPTLADIRKRGESIRDQLFRALAREPAEEPILFVVDNVPETPAGSSVRRLQDFCPALGLVTLLVTSRQRTTEPGVRWIPLGVLQRPSSVALLTHELSNSGDLDQEDWGDIASWVGDLPLALDLLNRSLALGAMTPHDLLNVARQQSPTTALDMQREALRGHVPDTILRGVTEAFSVSLDKLDAATQMAAFLLAQLAPWPIPEELIAAFDSTLFPPKVRTALLARHFITGNGHGSFGTMHRVLADFLRSAAEDDGRKRLYDVVATAVLSVMEDHRHKSPKSWPLMNAFRPHSEWLFERGIRHQPYPEDRRGLIGRLGIRTGSLLSDQGDLSSARRIADQVLKADRGNLDFKEQVLGPHPLLLGYKANKAKALWQQGDFLGAQRLATNVLKGKASFYGEEHVETVYALNDLAAIISKRNRRKGRILQEKALGLSRRLKDDTLRIACMGNLATTLCELGHLDKGRRLLEQALTLSKKVFGYDAPDTLRAMSNVSVAMSRQGEFTKARRLDQEVLDLRRTVLGPEHPDTLRSMNNLAETMRLQGELDQARVLHEKTLEIRRRLLGPEHPETLHSMEYLRITVKQQEMAAGETNGTKRDVSVARKKSKKQPG